MSRAPQIAILPDGRRLHLQDGPIDLVIEAFGPESVRAAAYAKAVQHFHGLLGELCRELDALREAPGPETAFTHPVARRMLRAVRPFASRMFITPMAAVAGAVADEILEIMRGVPGLERAYVNNGGDIALYLTPGETFTAGLVGRPDRPRLFGSLRLSAEDGIGGIATSGWRGRSFSLGIADAVTVLAENAAMADAAATVIANAVDCPGHPAITRAPAGSVQVDSDLGSRLVTRGVAALAAQDIAEALASGEACARHLLGEGLILGAALHLQGETRMTVPLETPARELLHA